MAQVYVFGDEAGDLVFKRSAGVSRYFILGTVTMHACAIGMELLDLLRDLALRGHFTLSEFHAKNNKWRVRDLVFDVMRRSQIRIDLTILPKAWVTVAQGISEPTATRTPPISVITGPALFGATASSAGVFGRDGGRGGPRGARYTRPNGPARSACSEGHTVDPSPSP